jgi:hypothetical protein
MKNILFLAAGLLMLFTSCRYSDCDDPYIMLSYELDTSGKLVFTYSTYEKGTGFAKLLNSELDSARIDSPYHSTTANHISIDGKYDVIISIPSTGKTYKISDISYSGRKRVRADGLLSENKTRCTRTINYNVNGQTYSVEGKTYEYGYGRPNGAVVTISK